MGIINQRDRESMRRNKAHEYGIPEVFFTITTKIF